MNRNSLRRAILAGCITLTLVASGFLLSRGALSASAPQSQHPEKYLPLILGKALNAQERTATAEASAGTAVSTATATTSPTSDAQATIQLHIVNATGWPLTFTLAGPTNASGSIEANQFRDIAIRPGHYTITAQTHCQTVPVEFDTVPDLPNDITYICPQ